MRSYQRIPLATQRLIAALVQLHRDTFPESIARRFGLSERHVRNLWKQVPSSDFPRPHDALMALRERARFPRPTLIPETAHGEA